MALPAYDQCIKASHVFNLLDARGVISVTERQSYILRVRELAKACGEAWLAEAGGLNERNLKSADAGRCRQREAGKSYWWCACGRSKSAVLRRLAQGHGVHPANSSRKRPGSLVLRLQAHRDADVRRQS